MSRVRVRHRIDRLAEQYADIPVKAAEQMPRIVMDNAKFGRDLAKALARAKAGPHGKAYYKRINAERTGMLTGPLSPAGRSLSSVQRYISIIQPSAMSESPRSGYPPPMFEWTPRNQSS